jgi:hypothetical protein
MGPAGKTLTRFIVVFVMLWATSACSLKMAYNNMDRLVRWQMSDYLDLDAQQRDYLQAQVVEFMAWHRKNHLPQYAAYLSSLSARITDGVSEAQIESMFSQMMRWGEEMEEHGMPAAIHLLVSMSDEQLAALPAKLETSNVEIAEDEIEVPTEEIQAQWADDFTGVMKRFVGRLDRAQRAYIARRSLNYQPERVLWADYRRRWQADLLNLLVKRSDQAFAENFRHLVKSREDYYGVAYQQVSEHNLRLSREVSAYILSNLSAKQGERVVEVLQDWAEDFSALAEQA